MQCETRRSLRQEIPAAVIDGSELDWRPGSNRVASATTGDAVSAPREGDVRYRHWLEVFRTRRLADPYHPDEPTFIDRRFHLDRQIPEDRVRGLFEEVLGSPLAAPAGRLVARRLGRPLEPFDIWYLGFKPRGRYREADLDAAARERYPTTEALAADLPRLLGELGFSDERARFLAERIVVEPSRGPGHAYGPARRDEPGARREPVEQRRALEVRDHEGYGGQAEQRQVADRQRREVELRDAEDRPERVQPPPVDRGNQQQGRQYRRQR